MSNATLRVQLAAKEVVSDFEHRLFCAEHGLPMPPPLDLSGYEIPRQRETGIDGVSIAAAFLFGAILF